MSQSELLCTLGPAVPIVNLAWPAGQLEPLIEPPNLTCARPEDWARSCRCPFHLARSGGKLEPLTVTCKCPEDWIRSCPCPFHRILSWVGHVAISDAQVSEPSEPSETELLCTLAQTVGLVHLAQPACKLEPPNVTCICPEEWARSCRCPFHRILSWSSAAFK